MFNSHVPGTMMSTSIDGLMLNLFDTSVIDNLRAIEFGIEGKCYTAICSSNATLVDSQEIVDQYSEYALQLSPSSFVRDAHIRAATKPNQLLFQPSLVNASRVRASFSNGAMNTIDSKNSLANLLLSRVEMIHSALTGHGWLSASQILHLALKKWGLSSATVTTPASTDYGNWTSISCSQANQGTTGHIIWVRRVEFFGLITSINVNHSGLIGAGWGSNIGYVGSGSIPSGSLNITIPGWDAKMSGKFVPNFSGSDLVSLDTLMSSFPQLAFTRSFLATHFGVPLESVKIGGVTSGKAQGLDITVDEFKHCFSSGNLLEEVVFEFDTTSNSAPVEDSILNLKFADKTTLDVGAKRLNCEALFAYAPLKQIVDKMDEVNEDLRTYIDSNPFSSIAYSLNKTSFVGEQDKLSSTNLYAKAIEAEFDLLSEELVSNPSLTFREARNKQVKLIGKRSPACTFIGSRGGSIFGVKTISDYESAQVSVVKSGIVAVTISFSFYDSVILFPSNSEDLSRLKLFASIISPSNFTFSGISANEFYLLVLGSPSPEGNFEAVANPDDFTLDLNLLLNDGLLSEHGLSADEFKRACFMAYALTNVEVTDREMCFYWLFFD